MAFDTFQFIDKIAILTDDLEGIIREVRELRRYITN